MTDKRTQIFEATERLIAEHGFHGTSMQMVAKEAGVATGTIYRYFKDKDDLMKQLYVEVMSQVAETVFEGLDTGAPLFEQFRLIWLNIQRFLLENPDRCSSKEQFENVPDFCGMERKELDRKLFAPLFKLFEQGIASGEIKPLPVELLSSLSIENAALLSKKHNQGRIVLTGELTETAIKASWEAITK